MERNFWSEMLSNLSNEQYEVSTQVWEMKKGKPTVLKLDGMLFTVVQQENKPSVDVKKPLKDVKKTVKKSYRRKPRKIEQWILDNEIHEFNPEDFLKTVKQYPRCKFDGTISQMIQEGKLLQMGSNTFRVTKKFRDLIK